MGDAFTKIMLASLPSISVMISLPCSLLKILLMMSFASSLTRSGSKVIRFWVSLVDSESKYGSLLASLMPSKCLILSQVALFKYKKNTGIDLPRCDKTPLMLHRGISKTTATKTNSQLDIFLMKILLVITFSLWVWKTNSQTFGTKENCVQRFDLVGSYSNSPTLYVGSAKAS